MSTSPIAGSSFSRAELYERAIRARDPMQSGYTNDGYDVYIDLLEQYHGHTAGDIVTNADQVASDAHQKANAAFIISLGGGVAGAAGAVLEFSEFSVPLGVGLALAGVGVGLVAKEIGDAARDQENDAEAVSYYTRYFAGLMADEAKTQPAPAPATTVPQQQPPEPAPVA